LWYGWRWFSLFLGGLLDFLYLDDFLAARVERRAAEIRFRRGPELDACVHDEQAQRERAEEVEEVALPADRIFLKLVQEVPKGLILGTRGRLSTIVEPWRARLGDARPTYVNRTAGVRDSC